MDSGPGVLREVAATSAPVWLMKVTAAICIDVQMPSPVDSSKLNCAVCNNIPNVPGEVSKTKQRNLGEHTPAK